MKTVSINQTTERGAIVTLQKLLVKYGFVISTDGLFGEDTKRAVMEFQRQHQLNADGIVGYRSWETLFFADRNCNQMSLVKEDFIFAANLLDCELAALMAVQQVETNGRGGFFEPGKPAILFEGHVFWSQLKKRGLNPEQYVKGNENILYEKWTKSYYKRGIAEYERLEQARTIHRQAADASASWGMFQIMGFNYEACGEKSVESFVAMMHKSELHQLLLSARFINNNTKMLSALQNKDWPMFSKYYNGPGYAANHYDTKLENAYKKNLS